MTELIRLEKVWKIYQLGGTKVVALRDVNLSIEQGEFVAVMGISGSGKSTMLNLLGCLDRPTAGRYSLDGQDVSALSDNELSEVRNLKIGFVFQSFNLIHQLSLVENIEVPLFYRGVPRRLRHPQSRRLAEIVGLGERLEHRPRELSGGESQRVAIARALANDPLVILADEPTGNLDSHTSVEILDVFDRLHDLGRTIVMVTHEDHVAAHAGRTVQLADGAVASDRSKLAEAGP